MVLEAAENGFQLPVLIPGMQAHERTPQPEVGEQFERVPGVLGCDQWRTFQDVERPQRDVIKVPDGRGHDEQGRHSNSIDRA